MSSDEDEFRFLKEAWKRVDAPRAFRELEAEDAPTRAAVSWLQSAYQATSPPIAEPRPQRSTRIRQLVAMAVAASLMSVTIRFIWKLPSEPVLEISHAPTPIYHPEQGQLELRSGPVRLLFLDQPK